MEYYGILGLDKPKLGGDIYNERDIRQAYRRKALELHPDKNSDDPQAPAKFNRLTVAFEFLLSEDRRSEYNNQLWESARKIQKIQQQDIEKRRLATLLKQREAAARQKETTSQATSFLTKTFSKKRSPTSATSSDDAAKKPKSFFTDLEQINLEKERLAHKERASQMAFVRPEVNAEHIFVLTLRWTSEREYTEARLRSMLRPHAPFKMLICDTFAAFIQFFDQSKALAAAVSISMPSEDQPTTSLTGVRVIKKPRSGMSINNNRVASIDIDDDEIEDCLAERRNKVNEVPPAEVKPSLETEFDTDQQSTAAASVLKSNPVMQRLLNRSNKQVHSKLNSNNYHSNNRTNFPEVVDLSSPVSSISPNSSKTHPQQYTHRNTADVEEIDIENNEFEQIESATISLLKSAIREQKKARGEK